MYCLFAQILLHCTALPFSGALFNCVLLKLKGHGLMTHGLLYFSDLKPWIAITAFLRPWMQRGFFRGDFYEENIKVCLAVQGPGNHTLCCPGSCHRP
jgi:hypothetical protein